MSRYIFHIRHGSFFSVPPCLCGSLSGFLTTFERSPMAVNVLIFNLTERLFQSPIRDEAADALDEFDVFLAAAGNCVP